MAVFNVDFRERGSTFDLSLADTKPMSADFRQTQVVETGDYDALINKPSINGVTLKGDKTFEELGDRNMRNLEIKAIFDRIFDKGGN